MKRPVTYALFDGLRRHGDALLVVAFAAAACGAVLTSRLPIKSDMSYLLPETAQSVRHLRALEQRARVTAVFLLGIESEDASARTRAAEALIRRVQRLPPTEVGTLTVDDAVARDFAWRNRFLFADEDDLTKARDALIAEANAHNPLYIELDDAGPEGHDGHGRAAELEALRRKLSDAESAARHPAPLVSADGRLQMLLLRANFNDGDLDRGARLADTLQGMIAETAREAGPRVRLGISADVIRGLVEQRGLVHGMAAATLVTVVAVLAALLLFFRSPAAVACLCWSLVVGCLVTFGVTQLTVGHLNVASAFLSSIVIGNGINAGIILLARYREECGRGAPGAEAVRIAVTATAPGTAAAALTACVAYLSLTVTPFRGFRDFGIIGSIGMLACWLSAYTVLPAGLLLFERRGWVGARPSPARAHGFERRLLTRPWAVLWVAAIVLVVAAVGTWRYVAGHPLETNLRNLGSHSADLDRAHAWTERFDRGFGSGISGGFAIAIKNRQDAPAIARRLRAVDQGKPEPQRLFSQISTLDDLLPQAQPAKLALLARIRRLIDRQLPRLDGSARADLLRLRPPDELRVLGDDDVPEQLAWPYTERDGSRGRIILANSGRGIDTWHTDDLERFATAVRALALGPDVLIGGASFVFADMTKALERDGPRTTIAAACGAVLVVLSMIGRNRYALATIACGAFGTLGFLALAQVVGLKVNFLDFVALPITIGIGIDYAVNIMSRGRAERGEQAGGMLATASAVALCSYTTIVGYGSLLASQNRGIRSFGLSAMLGEVACLATAMLVAPALLQVLRRR
jgi:predicted exporter